MLSIRWTRILTMEPAKFGSKPMAFESTLDTKSTEMKNLLVSGFIKCRTAGTLCQSIMVHGSMG